MSADEIVAAYPQLTLADVHAALAFYFDNRDEIERQMKEDREFVSAMKAKHASRSTPAPLCKEADADSLPS
jgi:hypothetical protein